MRNARMTIWVMAAGICLSVVPSFGICFDDNGIHNITWTIEEPVLVMNYTIVNVLDGALLANGLNACDRSQITVSGGSICAHLCASQYSQINILEGSISNDLFTHGDSDVFISGGSIENLHAYGTSTNNIFGQNFNYGSGLTLDGNRVLGTGILSGEWLDGTPWAVNIQENYSTATILAIPEPAVIPAPGALILGSIGLTFSGWLLKRKRMM